MSTETFAALVKALQDHMKDEGDLLLTDWYLAAAGVGTEIGSTMYLSLCSDSPAHSLVGMLDIARHSLDRRISSAI